MGKRVRKSTQIRIARKDAAQRKRAALAFQAPARPASTQEAVRLKRGM